MTAMNCSVSSMCYTPPKVIARDVDCAYEPSDDDRVVTDHWKSSNHCQSSYPETSSHSSRTRHTYSQQPRTHFDYNPRESSLSMSGVYTTPPSSAHLHFPPSSPYYPTTSTSPVPPLVSSGTYGMTSSLTSSYPSAHSLQHHTQQHQNHTNQYQHHTHHQPRPFNGSRYRTTEPYNPVPSPLPLPEDNRSAAAAYRSINRQRLDDWRSESWSAPSRYNSTLSTHQLNYRPNLPHCSNSLSSRLDIPSPSSPDSPPTSAIVSPRHTTTSSSSSFIDIVSHPQDTCIALGDVILLRCEARISYSPSVPAYQWYKDEEPLIGEVESEFRVSRASKDDLGYYFCVVSTMAGDSQRKSSTACISLLQGFNPCIPVILDQPDSTVVAVVGESLTLQLLVKAHPEPTYQWFMNGSEIPSAVHSDLVFHCVTHKEEGQYICSVKNELGSILSDTFCVYVSRRRDLPNPYTGGQPLLLPLSPTKKCKSPSYSNITDDIVRMVTAQLCRQIGAGGNIEGVRLALGISQSEAEAVRLTYNSLSDVVRELICIWTRMVPHCNIALLEESLQVYGLKVSVPTLTGGLVPEPFISQSQNTMPVIKVHPESVQVNAGEDVVLMVNANGFGLVYQWYKDGLPYPGLTQPRVVLTDVQASSTGLYHCCVKNLYGTVNSHPARVDIIPVKLKLPPSLQNTHYYTAGPSHKSPGMFSPPASAAAPRSSSTSENPHLENIDDCRPVTITCQPVSQSLALGKVLNLRVVCEGSGEIRYLWYFNGLAMRNETQSDFTLYCFTEDDVGDYSCKITNEYGTVMSEKAVISLQPDDDDDAAN